MFAYWPDETIYPLLSEKSDFQGPSCWEPSLDHATPSFDIRLWLVKDINRFLWSLFSKRNRSWKHGVQFHDWKSNSFDLLIWKVLSFTPLNVENEAVNKCSYLDFLQCWLWFLTDFSLPISAFPVFRVSGFLHFRFIYSYMAANQQFLNQIYWNFMESGISGIGIWLNSRVSASNELGKPYWKYRRSSHMRWYKRS